MAFSTYHSIQDINLLEDRVFQNCLPLSKEYKVEINLWKCSGGVIKSGDYFQTQFTTNGSYNNYFALYLCYPSNDPFIFNSNSISSPSAVLTPPGWKFYCYYPQNFKCYMALWNNKSFPVLSQMNLSKKALIWPIPKNFNTPEKFNSLCRNSSGEKFLDELLEEIDQFDLLTAKEFKMTDNLADQAFEYMKLNCSNGINIADLCDSFKISRRNLETSYRKTFGTSPGKHLRKLRLFNVRKELVASPAETNVADILNRQSITHISHFGQFYKDFFKEQMVETLKSRNLNNTVCPCHTCGKH